MKLLKKNNVTAMIVAMGLVTGLTGTALVLQAIGLLLKRL